MISHLIITELHIMMNKGFHLVNLIIVQVKEGFVMSFHRFTFNIVEFTLILKTFYHIYQLNQRA
jgi:mannitol-specific phosphotransferase system IIBC component